ncbi:MAG TPA: hypothetical protein DCL62_07585 [Kandleria vitulina]|nr:hypothetical protein [Kandleria vitulina]
MENLNMDVFTCFSKDWALVTCGEKEDYNTMLIGWGGLGTMWAKPSCTIYIRDSRYTKEYLDKNEYFTVSFFPKGHEKDLGYLGRVSGRDEDKIAHTSLTPMSVNHGMSFKEAKLTLVCKTMYKQRLELSQLSEDMQERFYKDGDLHNMYIAEVVEVIQ